MCQAISLVFIDAWGFLFLFCKLRALNVINALCRLLIHWSVTCAVSYDGLEMCEFWNERVCVSGQSWARDVIFSAAVLR